jgi:hypothetical protein
LSTSTLKTELFGAGAWLLLWDRFLALAGEVASMAQMAAPTAKAERACRKQGADLHIASSAGFWAFGLVIATALPPDLQDSRCYWL